MDDFVNVIKKDPKVRFKIDDMLDRYKRLPLSYQSKIGYYNLIQNVNLNELIKKMATTIVDIDREKKMKFSRIKYLESKSNSQNFKRVW